MTIENTSALKNQKISLNETNAQEKMAELRAQRVEKEKLENAIPVAKKTEAPKTDTVNLSSESKLIAKALDEFKNSPEIRDEKVAAVKKQIEEQQYQVNYPAVAKKIHSLLNL